MENLLPQIKRKIFFDLCPFLRAGGSANDTDYCAPAPTLNHLSQSVHHKQTICLGLHHANVWKSFLVSVGIAKHHYWFPFHISQGTHWRTTTLWDLGFITLLKNFYLVSRSKVLLPLVSPSNTRATKQSIFCWCYDFSFEWSNHKEICESSGLKQRRSECLYQVLYGRNVHRSSFRLLFLKQR